MRLTGRAWAASPAPGNPDANLMLLENIRWHTRQQSVTEPCLKIPADMVEKPSRLAGGWTR
jgi:hypothetical protein